MKINKHKNYKTIGILGGMGAAASANFYQSLVQIAQKKFHAENDDDFPAIWIYNLPITGFDETGFVNLENVKLQLIESLKKLEATGSDFIVIPCNTVHYLLETMRESIKIPILSILEITAKAVQKEGFKKVGLLNSQSTGQYQLYEKTFEKLGIATCSATNKEQLQVNEIIRHVMAGSQGQQDIDELNKIIQRFQEQGAQTIILGCTELPLAFSQKNCLLPVFNTTTILAEASLVYSFAGK